jgi:hypothetical protein
MKKVKKYKEPWKKKEPGARGSMKTKVQKAHSVIERAKMEEAASQEVTIIINKSLLALPGQYKSFTVKLRNPMRKDEIDTRMKNAFPDYIWREL